MGAGTTISIIVAVFGCLLAIFFYMNDSLEKKIDKAINNPDFIKKIAEHTKLPFLIFDENGSYQSESSGASAIIDKIEPFTEKEYNGRERFAGFIVYPTELLATAPILQAINSTTLFALPKKVNTKDWKYRIPENSGTVWATQLDEQPAKLYKLDIIK